MKTVTNTCQKFSLRTFLNMIGCWLLITSVISCASCQEIKPIYGQLTPSNPSYQNVVNLQDPLDSSRTVLLPDLKTSSWKAVAAAVMIKCEKGQQPEALTAAHVVLRYWRAMGGPSALVLGSGPTGMKNFTLMRVVKVDRKRDLALLRGLFTTKESCKTVSLARTHPILGSRIFAIGSPMGYPMYITSGIISSIVTDNILKGVKTYRIDAAVEGGMSGGGLFNDSGELVGIVVAFLEVQRNIGLFSIPYRISGHGIVISLTEIKDFLGIK